MLTLTILATAAVAASLPNLSQPLQSAVDLRPVQNPGLWATDLDYPREAKRLRQEGDVGFSIELGADGRPVSCQVVAPSKFPVLDQHTCALMMARARFKLAKKGKGQLAGATWTSSVHWALPSR